MYTYIWLIFMVYSRQIYTIPMVSQVLYWFVGLISPQVWSPSERLFSFSCRGWTLWHRTTNTKRFFASNIIWGRIFFFFADEFPKASSLVKDGIDRPGEFMRNSSSPKRLSEDCVRWMVFLTSMLGSVSIPFFAPALVGKLEVLRPLVSVSSLNIYIYIYNHVHRRFIKIDIVDAQFMAPWKSTAIKTYSISK